MVPKNTKATRDRMEITVPGSRAAQEPRRPRQDQASGGAAGRRIDTGLAKNIIEPPEATEKPPAVSDTASPLQREPLQQAITEIFHVAAQLSNPGPLVSAELSGTAAVGKWRDSAPLLKSNNSVLEIGLISGGHRC
ncbi:hypothetical protein NDU88_005216 [Pleurodeles waltl]|uniref:Uncharacterized protein n=1 Tax=Pleurodeles waltl TaxID=8319 RepID=A0AAV7VL07_PLEWA|nr:hypothetical protein NDU88_005216 [Pleurodeles waltl]